MNKNIQQIVTIKPMYLAREHAAKFLSLSESTLDNLVAIDDLPKPRKLSAGRSGWLVEELEEWGKARPISDLLPPINSGYGRGGKTPV
jgi:prophage regulatory protein